MKTEIELSELKAALKAEFASRAIRMSTTKLSSNDETSFFKPTQITYLKAVGTRELDRILEDVFAKFEPCEDASDTNGFWP